MRTIDLRGELGAIDVPALVGAGDAPPPNPPAALEGGGDGVSDLRVEWYAGARHSVWRDAPESLALVRDFVAAR
jgi:hypothetical protein